MKALRARLDATALRLVAGFGGLSAAAWGTWGWQAGLAAAGASMLVLDFLAGDPSEAAP